jgi:hypothetical protein
MLMKRVFTFLLLNTFFIGYATAQSYEFNYQVATATDECHFCGLKDIYVECDGIGFEGIDVEQFYKNNQGKEYDLFNVFLVLDSECEGYDNDYVLRQLSYAGELNIKMPKQCNAASNKSYKHTLKETIYSVEHRTIMISKDNIEKFGKNMQAVVDQDNAAHNAALIRKSEADMSRQYNIELAQNWNEQLETLEDATYEIQFSSGIDLGLKLLAEISGAQNYNGEYSPIYLSGNHGGVYTSKFYMDGYQSAKCACPSSFIYLYTTISYLGDCNIEEAENFMNVWKSMHETVETPEQDLHFYDFAIILIASQKGATKKEISEILNSSKSFEWYPSKYSKLENSFRSLLEKASCSEGFEIAYKALSSERKKAKLRQKLGY